MDMTKVAALAKEATDLQTSINNEKENQFKLYTEKKMETEKKCIEVEAKMQRAQQAQARVFINVMQHFQFTTDFVLSIFMLLCFILNCRIFYIKNSLMRP